MVPQVTVGEFIEIEVPTTGGRRWSALPVVRIRIPLVLGWTCQSHLARTPLQRLPLHVCNALSHEVPYTPLSFAKNVETAILGPGRQEKGHEVWPARDIYEQHSQGR